MSESLRHLTATIADHVESLKATSPGIDSALRGLGMAARLATRRAMLQTSHRYEALVLRAARNGASGPARAVADALLAVQEPLPWIYHYPALSAADDLPDRIAFAELIGPDGPMDAAAARVGFTVIAEQTTYPFHTHPAVELYLVISGHARWCTPASDHILPPGALILHRSNEPHSMQTFEEPLLALWGWSGDLYAPSVYGREPTTP